MTYEEYKKKKSENDSSSSSSGKISYADYRKKTTAKRTSAFRESARKYLDDYRNFATSAANDSRSMNWGNAAEMQSSRVQTAADLRRRGESLALFLEANKGAFAETDYNDITSAISASRQGVEDVMSYFGDGSRYYSRFKTEDDYRTFLTQKEQLSADTTALTQQIGQMRNLLTRYKDLTTREISKAEEAELAQMRKQYATAKDLEKAIKEKESYLEGAKTLQTAAAKQKNEAGWREKYAGLSYTELMSRAAALEDGDERAWITSYAPTTMTQEDTDTEYAKVKQVYDQLSAALEQYQYGDRFLLGAEGAAATEQFAAEYGSVDELKTRIEDLRAQMYRLENASKYNFLSENADFTEKSTYQGASASRLQNLVNSPDGTAQRDWLASAWKYLEPVTGNIYGALNYENLQHMTDDERKAFNYLYNTKGEDAAKEYLDYLQASLNERSMTGMMEKVSDLTRSAPVLSHAVASFLSTPINLLGGDGLLDAAGQKAVADITGEYKPVDYNRDSMFFSRVAGTIRGTVTSDIANATGVINFDKDEHPILSKALNGKSLGDVYQLGMSMQDSMAIVGLSMIHPALGQVGTALLGGTAGTQAMLDAVERGASDEQAITLGIVSGVAEMVFEKYELESLLGQSDEIIKSIFKQAASEAVGEGATEIANIAADFFIMADKSNWMQSVEQYMAEGKNQTQAHLLALLDANIQTTWAGIGGALMGGIMGGGMSAVQSQAKKAQREAGLDALAALQVGNDLPGLIAEALELDPKNALALKMQKQLNGGEQVSARDIRTLMEETAQKQDAKMSTDTAAQLLKEYGETGDITALSAAVAKQATGGKLTRAEQRLIDQSQYGQKAVDELNTRMHQLRDTSATQPAQPTQENTDTADTTDTPKETASQGSYEASTDGRTIRKSTGEAVTIKGVASIKGKEMTLRLEDGSEVSASDVAYASEDEALVYESVAKMGVDADTANVLIGTFFTGKVSADIFARGIQEAYLYGVYNIPVQEMMARGAFSLDLTDHQRKVAYELGQMSAGKRIARQHAAKRRPKGSGQEIAEGKVHFDGDRTKLNEMQKSSLSVMEVLAKSLGVQFYVFESWEENGVRYYRNANGEKAISPNGWYDPSDGSIHIDLYAGNDGKGTMLFTVAHELSHFIRQWSPAKFKVLANLVLQQYGEQNIPVRELIDKQIAKAKRHGRTIGFDEAYEEVVADSMEAILADGYVVQLMADMRAQDKTLWEKVRDWFKDLAQKLQAAVDAFRGVEPDSVEGKLVSEMQDMIVILESFYTDALLDAGENYQASLTPGEEGTVINDNGDPVAHATQDGTVQLSLRTYEEGGRSAFRNYLQQCVSSNRLTAAEMQEMMDGIEEIYQVCKKFKDKYAPFSTWSDADVVRDTYGKPVFSVVTPNGDYKMNLDFSLVCKKRRTLDAVFNEMSKRGIIDDFELGKKTVVKINEIIRKYGFETACALCFVDSKRFRQASVADSFTGLYNELVCSLVPEDQRGRIEYFNFAGNATIKKVDDGIHTWSASELDFSHIDHVLDTYGKKTVEYKAAKYIKAHPEGRRLLLRGDFMSSTGFDAVKVQNKDILKLYNAKKGAGGPKAAFGDVQYMNEIIQKAKSWTPKKAYSVGGVRIQSFSDYVPRMVFDYVQMVYDLAATKLPAHAYTKEKLFVMQFGLTGIKINMSLIPAIAEGGIAAGLDANGNYVWAGESFDYETAKEIQNTEGYTENCGTICVGVSYAHIVKLLSDPNIRMVIPYHKSGLNSVVAHMNKIAEFTDYSTLETNPGGCQNTIDKDGRKVQKDFDFYSALSRTGDPKAAAKEYLAWCDSNGYTAKFNEFRWHENYYKLLADFTLYDKDGNYVPQREVRAVFPAANSAFGSMKELIQSGLEEDAVIEGKRDKSLHAIVDEIQRTIPRTEAEIEESPVDQADRDLESGDLFSDRDGDNAAIIRTNRPSFNHTYHGEPDISIITPEALEVELNSAGLYLTSKENSKNRGRVLAYIKEHYPDIAGADRVEFFVDREEGYVYVHTIVPQKHLDEARIRLAAERERERERMLQMEAFQKRIHTPSGRARLMQSIEKRLIKDGIDAWVESSHSVVRTMSFYVFTDAGQTIKVSDHNTGFQAAEHPDTYFVDLNFMASVDEVYSYIRQAIDRYQPEEEMSTRTPTDPKIQHQLEQENESLREDVKYLREMLALQRKVTGGTKFTKTSVLAAARVLKQYAGAKGDTAELAGLLNAFYEGIATAQELTWEGVQEMAQPVVSWLQDHVDLKPRRSEYAQEILSAIRGRKIYLDESQIAEAAYRFGSYDAFRKSLMGSITLSKSADMSLDSFWHEMSEQYPYVFSDDVNSSDMPGALFDAIASLRNSDTSAIEYAHYRDMIARDLLRQVYDSYWNISTLRTVADSAQKKINALKGKHIRQMSELRAMKNAQISQLKAAHRAELEAVRREHRKDTDEKIAAIKQKHKDSRDAAVDGRRRTEMRHKIQRVVKELNSLLLSDDKKRHIPDSMKKAVAAALDLLELDTVNAEERLADYDVRIANETDPITKESLMETRERIRQQGENIGERLKELHAAYADIIKSEDPDVSAGYDPVIEGNLLELMETIGKTPFSKLSLEQLEDVYSMYRMVLTRVRDANKSFISQKNETISQRGAKVVREVRAVGGVHKLLPGSGAANAFMWNNLKPVYAIEKLGSPELKAAFWALMEAEGGYARDIQAAADFAEEMRKEYGYDQWDMDKKYKFTSTSGIDFELTLEQIMSLYAFSRRDQAAEHLRIGGFVFDNSIETYKETEDPKTGKKQRSVIKYRVNSAEAHQLSAEILTDIISTLDARQAAFVEKMQDYLSTTMGAKGNEVSMAMYGIKLFKERYYFPLKSSKQFLFEQNEVAGEVRIKNSGFTHKTKAKANNPIILQNFMDVWAGHVHDMSMYHAFTLPLEDFNRIFNFATHNKEGMAQESVKGTIQNAYGAEAVQYVRQMIVDLNGGARSDNREAPGKRLMSRFKKAAVAGSLSVAIQQPSALNRAKAMIGDKYFLTLNPKILSMGKLWEECKTYAPVAIIKEMGKFDMDTGLGTISYIRADKKTLIDWVDTVTGWMPAKADEWAWVQIWAAVKKEIAATQKDLDVGSEEFMQAAGRRFTEVIAKTQVYDSTLSRSANMRSKSGLMQMATAFMAEPTTSINMVQDAIWQFRRGYRRQATKTVRAVLDSMIANAVLVSLIYALRDDDEDETFAEKYASALTTELIDGANPLTYIPWVKDLWSIAQGFDVERSDMSLAADLYDSLQKAAKLFAKDTEGMTEEEEKAVIWQRVEACWGIVDIAASFFGVPVKNVRRDIMAAVKTIENGRNNAERGIRNTTGSFWSEVGEAVRKTIPVLGWESQSKADKLYSAISSGDTSYIERLKKTYVDDEGKFNESSYTTAVRKGLRENDPRIREAAKAKLDKDFTEYRRLILEIVNEGHFKRKDVVAAIDTEFVALKKK